jgi:hypothetical protein
MDFNKLFLFAVLAGATAIAVASRAMAAGSAPLPITTALASAPL